MVPPFPPKPTTYEISMEGKIKRLKKGPKRKKLIERNRNQLSWCLNTAPH